MKQIIPVLLGLLLLFGIGSAVSRQAFRAGWQQGYLTAKVDSLSAETDSESSAIPPAAMFGRGMGNELGRGFGHSHRGFGVFGLFLTCLALFAGLFFLKMLFWGFHHRRHPNAAHWGKRRWGWQDWSDDDDEPVQKA